MVLKENDTLYMFILIGFEKPNFLLLRKNLSEILIIHDEIIDSDSMISLILDIPKLDFSLILPKQKINTKELFYKKFIKEKTKCKIHQQSKKLNLNCHQNWKN